MGQILVSGFLTGGLLFFNYRGVLDEKGNRF